VSLVGSEFAHYATAARVARELVERIRREPMPEPVLLNVNVPDVPFEQLAGLEVTRLGRRHKAQPVVKSLNPRGDTVYWVGPAGAAREAGPGTDFNALERGAVSITPLQVDLTHGGQIDFIGRWLAA
jgi:5'-nucleotidase